MSNQALTEMFLSLGVKALRGFHIVRLCRTGFQIDIPNTTYPELGTTFTHFFMYPRSIQMTKFQFDENGFLAVGTSALTNAFEWRPGS